MLKNLKSFVLGPLVLTIIGWLGLGSPMVPYNIRELISGNYPFLSLLALVIVGYLTCGVPVCVVARSSRAGKLRLIIFPLLVLVQSSVVYVLLRSTVPVESIHDIVGSPVLKWSWEWEMMGRFTALYAIFFILLCGGALVALKVKSEPDQTVQVEGRWLLCVGVILVVCHWVVVRMAATDNLTELMAGGGGWFSSLTLGFGGLVITSVASVVSIDLSLNSWRGFKRSIFIVLLSIPLVYGILLVGTENLIYKYGQHFSALQFLLSPDRSTYLSGKYIFFRYVLVYIIAVIVVVVVQYPAWKMFFFKSVCCSKGSMSKKWGCK